MKILVLGGSGFIGSHLCERLADENHEVTVFHPHGATQKNLRQIKKKFQIIEGDFNNSSEIARALPGIEIVVHLVSATLPGNSLHNPTYDVQTNLVSSIQLFDQCVKATVKKVIFISSGGTVYGIPRELPIRESHPLNPISPYGISKLAIENYLAMYHHHFGLDYTILRLSNPFGPRQEPNRGQGVIATWLSRIIRNDPVEIWGDGQVVRDYLFIDDAVQAIELAISTPSESKVFNVGSGKGYSLLTLLQLIENQIGRPVHAVFGQRQPVDVPRNVLEIGLIKRELGWAPQIKLEDGILRFWKSLQ